MSYSPWFLTAVLLGTQVVLVQPAVMATKSAAEVQSIAQGVTVEIQLQQDSSVGSGIIIARSGNLYTIATNRHVVCGKNRRDRVPAGETYELGLVDGQKYRVTASSVKLIGTDLDLAIVRFQSSRNYPVVKLGTASALKVNEVVYTAGFPLEQPGFSFNQGNIIAVVDRRITGDRGGYSVVYDAFTLPGMSGGGVFDRNGLLVAIHGQGERFGENTELGNKTYEVGSKIGYNRGIPIRWLVEVLASAEVKIGEHRPPATFTTTSEKVPVSAGEYFIAGFNKLVEPGDDVVAGKRAAIQLLSEAIRVNSRYTFAYLTRAYVYSQLQEFRQSLSDLDRAITLNPQFAKAYNNRGNLKYEKLNDLQGALADFDRAIAINPQYAVAYNNRGNLKNERLNDIQGALSDYNQAIIFNPQYAVAYNNRGNLKNERLNDIQGALTDYDRAIIFNPQYALAYYNRGNLKNERLNDIQGALTDYDRAISLNPQDAKAYANRGILKAYKLNDKAGTIQDLRRSAKLFRAQGQTQNLQRVVDVLRQLGAAE
jgi:tetratricopeptide (TPR) repeat protein